MDKAFQPSKFEEKLYSFWEKEGLFTASISKDKKPFSIILPPPNANADLHMGHAMYVFEDLMIRYYKMKGYETLWLPGADHAGFETQFVFEKELQKKEKSRFDYDRDTLFKLIWDFVSKNRGNMEEQLRKLGFSLDWTKAKFTMDKEIIKVVHETFKKLHEAGLIYREKRLVNYCVNDGTSFSDLEAEGQETEGLLYFIKYPLEMRNAKSEMQNYIEVATTRPETMLGDVAVAVHPKDKKYQSLIGKKVKLPRVDRLIPIIADETVDPKFGTGAVKVTPAHDENDWEIAKRHNLPSLQVISFQGRIQNTETIYDGLKVNKAREQIINDLHLKSKKHKLVLKTCYKCKRPLEPLPLEQWFVKIRPLADGAIKLVSRGEITIHPKRFKKVLIQWLENFHDWNISRQIVWGIRIPAWNCQKCKNWIITEGEQPSKCPKCDSNDLKQDEDTFDTWFSSAQWPYATLRTIGKEHFDYFYPTSVMETGYDILPWWVARMIMVCFFTTKEVPFKTVFLHGLVRDKQGQKMSKSRGNVINPMDMIERYGADAVRASLIFGIKEGNNIAFSENRIVGMRNFANKIWNIGRFMHLNIEDQKKSKKSNRVQELRKEFEEEKRTYHKHMEHYQFSKALDLLYEFLWHRFADYYIEQLKDEFKTGNIEASTALKEVFFENLKMLHPFMPYVTEAIYQTFKGEKNSILNSKL